jgi:hypothetical protein
LCVTQIAWAAHEGTVFEGPAFEGKVLEHRASPYNGACANAAPGHIAVMGKRDDAAPSGSGSLRTPRHWPI